jgi:Integrase core domain
MAGVAITQQFGRPHTPPDQAWIETLFGHVKGEWPHLEKIRDPGELEAELARVQAAYNAVRLHAAISYVTPDDEHEGHGDQIRQARATGSTRHAWPGSLTVETTYPTRTSEHEPSLAGYYSPGLAQRVRHTSGGDAVRLARGGHPGPHRPFHAPCPSCPSGRAPRTPGEDVTRTRPPHISHL